MSDTEHKAPTKFLSIQDGLKILIDIETREVTLDWDPETHPKWNIIDTFTEEELVAKLVAMLDEYQDKTEESTTTSEEETTNAN